MASVTRDEAIKIVQARVPEPHATNIVASLRPSIRIRPQKVSGGNFDIGASRLGGNPDVPDDFEWPHWHTELEGYDQEARRPFKRPAEDRPLAFLAQIRLSDVTPLDIERLLPPSGWLYFFYDVEAGPW